MGEFCYTFGCGYNDAKRVGNYKAVEKSTPFYRYLKRFISKCAVTKFCDVKIENNIIAQENVGAYTFP